LNNKYIFLVTSYNCRPYIDACITSMLMQSDKDFGVIFVDDASTDGTVDRINEFLRGVDLDYEIYVNEERTRSAAWNQYQAVIKHVKNPNSKIMILDADDTLYDNNSFDRIKKADNFLPFTSIKYEAGVLGYDSAIPRQGIPSPMYRIDEPYHLRYFNAWLYKAVPESMYYKDGELIAAGSDLAFIYPVIDLLDKKFNICNFLVYKWNNHLRNHNDHFLRLNEQRINCDYIKNREKMSPLTQEEIQEIKDNWNT
jgi:glycosyltransferase involved in cell wall biosynthesis